MAEQVDQGELVIRPFRTGDEAKVNQAFNTVFTTQRSLAEWAWKFPPGDGSRPIMLAWQDGDLLAQYAATPVAFQLDDCVFSAAQIVDVFSTRQARRMGRRGVWVQTVEAFFEHYGESRRHPLLFGFPGRRALRLGVLQLGYDAIPPQEILYLERREPAPRGRAASRLYRAELARDWEPRLDDLWRRCRRAYPVAAIRGSARALGRLAGRPGGHYHRFLVFPRLSPSPVAFAAFRVLDDALMWVDLVWDHEHPGALHLLARLAAGLGRQEGVACERLWLNGDPEGVRELERAGFDRLPEPSGLVFVARAFGPDVDVQLLDERIYLTMADADLV